ncbi:MAG: hypothetical protein J0H34_08020 [Rhizobiales bacterium]|nr:hypothetical protein [Hyphomicrobiales bacterium]
MTGLLRTLAWVPRALILTVALAAPVLAAPALDQKPRSIIEAPQPKNTGIGFVLLMSLRRG